MPVSFIEIDNSNIPKNIQYVAEHFNIPDNTDLLISSGVYLHLLKQSQIHYGKNFPASQETN